MDFSVASRPLFPDRISAVTDLVEKQRVANRRRVSLVGLVLLCLLGLGAAPAAIGADAETRAFTAAAKAFQDEFAERAEREFAAFVARYPESPRVAEAILLQARAAFSQNKPASAQALLSTNLVRAGQLADQYRYWLGRVRLESGDAKGAASEFAQLLRDHTNSPRRLEASYHEAKARFQLQEWGRVVELLGSNGSAFQQAAKAGDNPEIAALGQVLLGESLFKLRDFQAAESAAQRIPAKPAEVAWARQYLLCRLALATEREQTALQGTTNLLTLAAASGRTSLQAQSLSLRGAILEEMQDYDAALIAYDSAQAAGMPEEQRREAFTKSIELLLSQDKLAAASARLERFLASRPEDAASDSVLLTLGELRLKEHLLGVTNAVMTNDVASLVTNRLQQAIILFEQLPQKYPQSPAVGKAHLNRGWALLAGGQTVEAQACFQLATNKLPFSEDQAIARFKLADTQFLQNDFTNALAGYRRVIDEYGGLPRIRTGLFDRAWYQIARISIKLGNLEAADDALRRILAVFPSSLYSDRGFLLLGQELNQTNRPAQARAMFTEFCNRFTNSTLLPQAQLGLARAYELENNWAAAIKTYDTILRLYPTNEVAPRADFFRALAWDRAGQESNTLASLTNFLARFPTHELAPRAQDWIGDHYFRDREFVAAEKSYQLLYQNTNWPLSELKFQAWFKAGRSAFMRQSYDNATNYFLSLINDKLCPSHVVAEAFFAYGDTLTERPIDADGTNAINRFETAIGSFLKIPQLYAGSPLVPRALGRIADCYFQIASVEPGQYTNASAFYQKALAGETADLATRSQAEVGLANALSGQARLKAAPDADLLKSALDHYLNVVYGLNLRDTEAPIPFWQKEAGLAAARLLESQKRWSEAIQLYVRLQQDIPPLRAMLEKRIASARDQMTGKRE